MIELDSVGLRASAWVVRCPCDNKSGQISLAGRGMTEARAIAVWNENTTKAVQS